MRSALTCLALVACASEAHELARWEGDRVLEVSGFYKNGVSAFALQPSSVEGAHALSLLAGTPDVPPGGVTDANILRLASRFRFGGAFELDAAWQLTFLGASSPVFTSGASLNGTVGAAGSGPQRRLVALGGPLASGGLYRLEHDLDRLALKVALPFGDLTVGRQVLSWGTGRFWNPTDVLSPFAPTAIDREVRRGFDAVRLAVALGEVTQLDVLYLPQPRAVDMGGVVRFQTNVEGWDGSLSVGKYVDDLVFGFDLAGDVGAVAVHAEGAYTLQLLGLGTPVSAVGEHFFRGVVGADVKPRERVVLTAEYAYNGFGTNEPDRYAAVLSSARAQRGEVFGAGLHTLALAASWSANDLFSTQLAMLWNVSDPSALVLASAEYSALQWLIIRASAFVPLGRAPDAAVFTRLTPADVAQNSPAYLEAARTRGLRSEYGSGSYGGFLQVGVYLP